MNKKEGVKENGKEMATEMTKENKGQRRVFSANDKMPCAENSVNMKTMETRVEAGFGIDEKEMEKCKRRILNKSENEKEKQPVLKTGIVEHQYWCAGYNDTDTECESVGSYT